MEDMSDVRFTVEVLGADRFEFRRKRVSDGSFVRIPIELTTDEVKVVSEVVTAFPWVPTWAEWKRIIKTETGKTL